MASALPSFTGQFFKLDTLSPAPKIVDHLHIDLIDLDPSRILAKFTPDIYAHQHANPTVGDTLLDIDCRAFTSHNKGEAVEVTIEINPRLSNVSFVEPIGNVALLPITAGSADAAKILFNYTLVSDKKLQFLIVWNDKPDLQPFNLCMVFSDLADPRLSMPVIYDPKVQNDG